MWKSGVLSLLLLGFALSFTFAQQRTVTGTVTSEDEGALPGVNIVVQGTTQGAVTDAQGNYTISVPGDDATLVFSFIGYSTQAVTVGSQSTINVTLTPDVTSLDEIVVTAYATQKKKDLTGSVGIVSTEELVQMPQSNVTQQIQGRVAGVTVTQDSRPGQSGKVRIRGFSSFQDNSPLYVIDGISATDINTINPEDIESMTVLKDAGAASIYGARASNGVIVITTKKGSAGGIKVNYNGYVGTQNPGKGPQNLLNTQEYADLQWLVYANDGISETHPFYGPSSGDPTIPFWGADTNWWAEATQNAMIQNHDLSMSGGNQNSKYYASIGYFDQDGTTLENWFKRYSMRFNSEFNIKDRVTVGENINLVYRADNGTNANGSETSAIMTACYRTPSIIPVIWNSGHFEGLTHTWEDGDWGGTGIAPRLGQAENFVATKTRAKYNKWQNLTVMGNVFADVKILEGLNFRSTFGGSLGYSYYMGWSGKTYERAENYATSTYNENASFGGQWSWTNTLTFARVFGDHNILAVAGYEAVRTSYGRGVSATGSDYYSEEFLYRTVSNGASLLSGSSYLNTQRSLVSQFLRADYNFRSKYYLSGTVRRDGASVFGPDTRYGIFPSVTAGWRISEESFLAGADFINDFKIRGGYGTMGNQLPVSTANQYFLFGGSPRTTYYDLNGTMNSSLQGFRPTRVGNVDAKWETNVTTNVGFDAVLFDRKLELDFDYYIKTSKDLLFNPDLPGTAGTASAPYVNVGEMKNTGIDVQLIYHQNWGDFSFEANATFTTYKNEIVKIADGYPYFDSGGSRIGAFNRNQTGYSMGQFFGYNVIGLFQEADVTYTYNAVDDVWLWVTNEGVPAQDGAEPGVFRYEDVNGNGEIDDGDRTFIGNPNPDFTYGLNLVFGYKGFDLTAFFYGSQGNEIFNYNRWWIDFWPSFQGQKSTDLLYNSWTPERTDATVPKATQASNLSTNTVSNSYYIEDGSFFRLKNLQIGYTFDKSILGNVFSSARIYLQATNLFTITKYTGMDPELASFNDTYSGVDEGNLPAVQQYLVGVSLGF
jgi:TonB-dependent starch-binding outer membrane protein SusC